jgi:hypothetical protein
MNGLSISLQGVGYVLRMLLVWVELSSLCLISFVLRLQDNFGSFVTIAKFGIHRNIYNVVAAVSLIITSNRPIS